MFLNTKIINLLKKITLKSLMKNRMANELFNEIVPVVLKEEDLNAMYHSIENRSPYLDSNLFKHAFNMPPAYYVKNGLAKMAVKTFGKRYRS